MRNYLGVALVTAVVAVSTYFAFQLERAGTPWFWLLASAPTTLLAIFALVRAGIDGNLRDWIRPVWGDFTRGVLGAAVVFAIAYGYARWCVGSPRESWLARLYLQLGSPETLRQHPATVAAVIAVAAASEELVWRGLVTSWIAEKVGTRTAWAWAALPYTLALVPTMWTLSDPEAGLNPILPLAGLVSSLVWGAMVRKFDGRLVPAILAHGLFDWVVVMTFRLWGVSV
jgi:hypothetical protein